MDVRSDEGLVVKRAAPGDEHGADRLRSEAAILDRLRHPGIVQLMELRDEPGTGVELCTVRVVGAAWTSLAGADPSTIARAVAALATTIADLHDLGVTHQRLTADHVLLDPAGRPVVCGFGGATATLDAENAAGDVAAIGRLLADLLPGRPGDPLASLRARPRTGRVRHADLAAALERLVAESTAAEWTARPTARTLADQLWSAVDQAAAAPSGRIAVRSRDWWARRMAGGAAVVVALLGWYTVATARPARPAHRAASVHAAPPVPSSPKAGGGNVVMIDGHRYEVGGPGDQVVVGRFDCAHTTAAVLTPLGGLFVFDQLAGEGTDVTARHLRDVDPSAALSTADHDGDGCEELVVRPVGGEPIILSGVAAS